MADEYLIAVWIEGGNASLMNICVEAKAPITSTRTAADYGRSLALKCGVIAANEPCEIDVSEDASDEWLTFSYPDKSRTGG